MGELEHNGMNASVLNETSKQDCRPFIGPVGTSQMTLVKLKGSEMVKITDMKNSNV